MSCRKSMYGKELETKTVPEGDLYLVKNLTPDRDITESGSRSMVYVLDGDLNYIFIEYQTE